MKILKKFGMVFVLMLACSAFFIAACNNGEGNNGENKTILDLIQADGRPNYDDKFDFESGYEQGGAPEAPIIIPADPGGNNVLRMEAEKAEVKNLVNSSGNAVTIHALEHYRFDTRLSGCIATANVSKSNKTQLIFTFESDKSYSGVKVTMRFGSHPQNQTASISSLVTITCNDNNVTPSQSVNWKNDTEYCGSQYMRFNEYEFEIQTEVGENQLIFTYNGQNNGGNLDYVEIHDTACALTDKTHGWYDTASKWEITTYPTETANGQITVTGNKLDDSGIGTSKYPLLPLSEANGYKKETVNGQTIYSFSVLGQTFRITSDGKAYAE